MFFYDTFIQVKPLFESLPHFQKFTAVNRRHTVSHLTLLYVYAHSLACLRV